MSKQKSRRLQKKSKQAPIKHKTKKIDVEYRNAFRVLKRATAITGDLLEGNLYNLPITLTPCDDETSALVYKLDTHQEVLFYAAETLMAVGFSLESALQILMSKKDTKAVLREMYAKT